jgi:hypothetical protein
MNVRQKYLTSRQSITIAIAAALASVVSLAISAQAVLNKAAIATQQDSGVAKRAAFAQHGQPIDISLLHEGGDINQGCVFGNGDRRRCHDFGNPATAFVDEIPR